mgnify:CR=1 FL=1
MFFLDEIIKDKITKKKFLLPLNTANKRKGSLVHLLTPNFNSSVNVLKDPKIIKKYFSSYYMEKSPVYYISSKNGTIVEESTLVNEVNVNKYYKASINNIDQFTFNGLDKDIDDVAGIIYSCIHEYHEKYHFKIKDEINIYINRSKHIQECTKNEIYILSKTKYDQKTFDSYDKYVKMFLHLLYIQNVNPRINKNVLMASALVLSGIVAKSNYNEKIKIDSSLISLCKSIIDYIDSFGEKEFINTILIKNNTDRMITDIFKSKLKNRIVDITNNCKSIFAVNEELEFYLNESQNEYCIYSEGCINIDSDMIMVLDEADSSLDGILKRNLFKDRIKTNKDLLAIYKEHQPQLPNIKFTYLNIDKYKGFNLFNDLYYYNEVFFRNNNFSNLRGYQIYLDFMERMLKDKRFNSSYKKTTVIIPVNDWLKFCKPKNDILWMTTSGINPISCIYKCLMTNPEYLIKTYKGINFVFLGNKSYFVTDFGNIDNIGKARTIFLRNIKFIINNTEPIENEDDQKSSPKAIATDIIDKIEKAQKLNISNITPSAVATKPQTDIGLKTAIKTISKTKEDTIKEKPDSSGAVKQDTEGDNETNKEVLKQELVDRVVQASSNVNDTEDALDKLNDDERVKEILSTLAAEPDDGPKMSAARTSRLLKLEDDFLDKEFKNKNIRDFLTFDENEETKDIEPIALDVDSVNPEWKELKYANMNEKYDLDRDILAMFNFFHDKRHPLVVKDISVEDTSTSDDAIETYTVVYENENGKRFTVVIDIPKFIDGKYMKLRGNIKNISSQLFPIPIMKTEEDTVQIATCYNKIFIRRFGSTLGKSNAPTDRLIKTLSKGNFKDLKLLEGDNTRVCSKYEVPVDYIDIGSAYSEIETKNYLFQFNQDKLRKDYGDKIDLKNGFPFGIDKRNKSILYYNANNKNFIFLSTMIVYFLETELEGFSDIYNKTTTSVKYTFSQASLLASKIPLIVVCAYSEGLEKVLRKAGIEYELSEKRPLFDKDQFDIIRFKDGYLKYRLTYASSLLMNGLKVCNTEDFSLTEINLKTTYVNFLDMFGGRIKADGLDNFYELLIDYPITYNSLKYYKLPTDYISLLLYANQLLTDNKFIKHTDITSSRRIRRNELIADLLYRNVLSKAYGDYCTQIKHRGQGVFSVKRNALINAVLLNNTTEDQSIINALNEYEAYNRITPEGPGGLNTSRAYTLDKRGYDDSMKNVLSMSTGFSGKVGIPRQATIDANVNGYRGYITSNSEDNEDEINVTKTLCMTEALTPYGITRDDPFRSAMNFVQTSKHGMRCRHSDPLLITTGADEALPYLISDIFAYKAKGNGKVIEKDDNHMIIEYSNKNGEPTYDYIDLTEQVEKNSSSGFFVVLKLDSDLRVGSKVKEGQIVAYDKSSFSDEIGIDENIAYNIGTLNKFAILNTDEGYEDSAIISHELSEKMTTDIVIKREVPLPKDTNVYNMVKKGQAIKEGDPLLIIQKPYDEDDMNSLLKALVADEDSITELGRQPITSKVTGVVQDIIISRTVEKNELSSSLKKIVTEYEKEIDEKKKTMDQYGIDKKTELPSTEKLPATGKLKNCEDGVLIEFYLKYEDKMSVGDKLIYYSALKGVVKDIFPEGKEPTSEYRPDEKIHSLLSIGSVNGRMTCSILITSAINKGLIELSRKVKDILDIPYDVNL